MVGFLVPTLNRLQRSVHVSTGHEAIEARLRVLALAKELKNVSAACKIAGISRSYFYEIKKAFETQGYEGLAPRQRTRPRMPNATPPELEARILEVTGQFPAYSYIRISEHLRRTGVPVRPSTVRAVWCRHGLRRRNQRLLWVEQK